MNRVKEFFKKYKSVFNGVLTVLGVIAVYDWIIAPGLTAKNTFVNILALIAGVFLATIIGIILFNAFKNEDEKI